jgi:hypothetical protein
MNIYDLSAIQIMSLTVAAVVAMSTVAVLLVLIFP